MAACTTHSRNDASEHAYPPSGRNLWTSTKRHVSRIVPNGSLKWPNAWGCDLLRIRHCVRRGRRMLLLHRWEGREGWMGKGHIGGGWGIMQMHGRGEITPKQQRLLPVSAWFRTTLHFSRLQSFWISNFKSLRSCRWGDKYQLEGVCHSDNHMHRHHHRQQNLPARY